VVSEWNKVSIFTPDGKLVEEFRFPMTVYNVGVVGENLIGEGSHFDRDSRKASSTITVFDRKYNVLTEIVKRDGGGWVAVGRPGRTSKQDRKMIYDYFECGVYGDRVYIADSEKGFFIEIFDSMGKKLYEINKPYTKKKVTGEFKKRIMNLEKAHPKWETNRKRYNYIFPEYFPAFRNVFIVEEKIYVETYETRGNEKEIIIMDLKGNTLKRIFFDRPWGPLSIRDGYWYYLVENEDTDTYEVHRKKIE